MPYYKTRIEDAKKLINTNKVMNDLSTALKYWTYDLDYLGYYPRTETIEEIYKIFIQFIRSESVYFTKNQMTACYLEALGFIVDRKQYCTDWYAIHNPLCIERK